MAKKDRVGAAAAYPAVPEQPAGMEAGKKPETVVPAAAPEQLHLIPPPLPDEMVQQILERQAIFGF